MGKVLDSLISKQIADCIIRPIAERFQLFGIFDYYKKNLKWCIFELLDWCEAKQWSGVKPTVHDVLRGTRHPYNSRVYK